MPWYHDKIMYMQFIIFSYWFVDVAEKKVWGKIGARMSLLSLPFLYCSRGASGPALVNNTFAHRTSHSTNSIIIRSPRVLSCKHFLCNKKSIIHRQVQIHFKKRSGLHHKIDRSHFTWGDKFCQLRTEWRCQTNLSVHPTLNAPAWLQSSALATDHRRALKDNAGTFCQDLSSEGRVIVGVEIWLICIEKIHSLTWCPSGRGFQLFGPNQEGSVFQLLGRDFYTA
jgi:hypothetical protein